MGASRTSLTTLPAMEDAATIVAKNLLFFFVLCALFVNG